MQIARLSSLVFVALSFATPLCAQDELEAEILPQAEAPSYAAPTGEIGRYQLFEGQFAVISSKEPERAEKHLYRVDTATGKVWIGKQVQYLDRKTGRQVQQRYWEPFEQYIEAPSAAPAR